MQASVKLPQNDIELPQDVIDEIIFQGLQSNNSLAKEKYHRLTVSFL